MTETRGLLPRPIQNPPLLRRADARQLRFGLIAVVFGVQVLAIPAQPASQGVDLTGRLPPETIVAVQIPDVAGLIAKWRDSPLRGLYEDPRAQELIDPLRRKLGALDRRLSERARSSLGSALASIDGPLLLVGMPGPAGDGQPVQWALMFRPHDDATASVLLEQIAIETLGDAGDRSRTVVQRSREISGARQITRLRAVRESSAEIPIPAPRSRDKDPRDKAPPSVAPSKGAVGLVRKREVTDFHGYSGPAPDGGRVAILASVAGRPIDSILSVLEDPAGGWRASDFPAATENEASSAGTKAAGVGDFEVFVQLSKLARWVEADSKRLDLPPALDVRALGLDDLQWLALRGELKPDRLDLAGRIKVDPRRRGIGRLLNAEPGAPPDAAKLAPAETLFYSAAGWPLDRLAGQLLDLLAVASPAIDQLIQGQLQNFETATGVNLRRDLLDGLGGQLVHFAVPAPAGGDGDAAHDVWMLETKTPAAFADALRTILTYGSQTFGAYRLDEDSRGEGAVLWTLRTGRPGSEYVGPPMFHVGLGGGWLLLGRRSGGIDAALRQLTGGASASLADVEAFARVREALPAARFAEIYADPSGLLTHFLSALFPRAERAFQAADRSVSAEPGGSARALADWIGPLGAARSLEPDGISVRVFVPLRRPEAP
jgi:hypothetical protein